MCKRAAIFCLFFAGLISLSISFSQFLYSQSEAASTSVVAPQEFKAGAPMAKGGVTSVASPSTASLALPTPFVIQSHLQPAFLFQIFSEDKARADEDGPCLRGVSFFPDTYFRIVFTLIICPNAP